jgi:hypothetical protein
MCTLLIPNLVPLPLHTCTLQTSNLDRVCATRILLAVASLCGQTNSPPHNLTGPSFMSLRAGTLVPLCPIFGFSAAVFLQSKLQA